MMNWIEFDFGYSANINRYIDNLLKFVIPGILNLKRVYKLNDLSVSVKGYSISIRNIRIDLDSVGLIR